MNSEEQPIFECHKLSLRYAGKPAFNGVSLAIRRGRITALVGPSGCGKSSFLSCLNRLDLLEPSASVSGQLRFAGLDLMSDSLDPIALRCRVGLIFQRPNPFPLSIRRNLTLPLKEHGLADQQRLAERVEQVLRNVGLWSEVEQRLDQGALSLSGGQQQRLCIARALTLDPEALLMDEPCSALDPVSSGIVEDLITSLRGKYSVVIVTHNLAQARRIADDVAFFWWQDGAGCLLESGTATELFDNPQQPETKAYFDGARG